MTITIIKPFGVKDILKFNPHLPDPYKLRGILLARNIKRSIVERIIHLIYQGGKESITIRRAHSRSRNGDLLIY